MNSTSDPPLGLTFGRFRVLPDRGTVAAALGRAGQIANGLVAIEDAIDHSERIKENWAIPELLRIKGELLLQSASDASVEAEHFFRQALDLATARRHQPRPTVARSGPLRPRGGTTAARLRPLHRRFRHC
jgi:hypothetical protein